MQDSAFGLANPLLAAPPWSRERSEAIEPSFLGSPAVDLGYGALESIPNALRPSAGVPEGRHASAPLSADRRRAHSRDPLTGLGVAGAQSSPPQLGAESDDYAASVLTLGSIPIGGSRTGTIETSGDHDWFRVSLTAGHSYRFNLNATTPTGLNDPVLTLRDSAGMYLDDNDDIDTIGENFNSQISFLAESTGFYYLDASGFLDDIGSYSLLAIQTDDCVDNASTTSVLSVGGSSAGTIEAPGDHDWFRVALTAGHSYRFNLNAATPTGLSDPVLTLRDSTGIYLTHHDDIDTSAGNRNSQIIFLAASTGTYYLDASAFSDGTGSYSLLAVDTTPVDDYSANTSTNGLVSVGGNSAGTIEASGDHDWFRVALTAGRSYRFNLNGTTVAAQSALTDPWLSLRNGAGELLSENDDVSSSNRNSEITFTPTTTGTYYLDASAYSTLTGAYRLSVADTTPTDDYTATTSTSGVVSIGGSSNGAVNTSGDRDWFRIALTAGRTYRFSLDRTTLSDPTLYLRSPVGVELAYNDDGNDLNSVITYVAQSSGNYYLDAGDYSSGTGGYRLSAADVTPVDDYAATTSTTGVVTVGASSAGVVNSAADRDWFRVTLTAGLTYRFRLNGVGLSDPNLSLRSALGVELDANDDFNGLNAQITYTATSTGTYFLDAGGYGSNAGSYTLSAVSITAPTTTDDYLDTTATTGSVTLGVTSRGMIEAGGDSDWFRISLNAGSTYRFTLIGATVSDTLLYLRDSLGDEITLNDDITIVNLNSRITYTAPASGLYFLDARAYGGLTGRYSLSASLVSTPVPVTDDYADSAATTGTVSLGGTRSGVVNRNGDRDWFAVVLQAGQTYRFSALAGTLLDPELSLRSAAGTQLSYANDSGGARHAVLDYTCTTAGTYYLDVGSFNNLGIGAYSLQAINLFLSDDYTANTSTTGVVNIGGSTTGRINASGDRDWFRVSLVLGTTYRFTVTGGTLTDPNLYLRDSSGGELVYNDDASDRNPQITYTALASGSCYLDVGSYLSDGIGTYTVQASSVGQAVDDFAADTTTTGSLSVGRVTEGSINFVGDRDWQRITLTSGRTYKFNLDGNTLSDPTLRLLDGAGTTVIATNDNFGTGRNAQITFPAPSSGTYYLDAGAVGALLGSYSLRVTDVTTDGTDRIVGLQDATLRQAVNAALSDSLFTNLEIASLLRGVASGSVSALEFADLRLIGANLGSYLSATSRSYSAYIYNAVVNGNPANRWWTGGGASRVALGNLAVGSSETQLNRLVDKWFAGLDLPTNFCGGDTAANADYLSFSYAPMTGSLFVNDVNYDDVNQGQAGTCYVLAAMASFASSNKQVIRNMFCDNGNGTYGVRFYGNSGNEIWVTVNQAVPVVNGRMALVSNATRSLAGEMWVALAEKAYAQANEIGQFGRATTANSYFAIEGGYWDALSHLSNLSATAYSAYWSGQGWTSANNSLATWNTYRNAAISALSSGHSLYLASGYTNTWDDSGKLNFVKGHAFAVVGFNQATGNFIVVNPWGMTGTGYAPVFEASWETIFSIRAWVAWV